MDISAIINKLEHMAQYADPNQFPAWIPNGPFSPGINPTMFDDRFGWTSADFLTDFEIINGHVYTCSVAGCMDKFILKGLRDGSALSYELSCIEHLYSCAKMSKLMALIMTKDNNLFALYVRTSLVCADLAAAFETCFEDLHDVRTTGIGLLHTLDRQHDYEERYNKLMYVLKIVASGMAEVSLTRQPCLVLPG
jgi:hypothetical protein